MICYDGQGGDASKTLEVTLAQVICRNFYLDNTHVHPVISSFHIRHISDLPEVEEPGD